VLVRNLDDAVVERYRQRARARGVSLEQELREVITRTAELTAEEKLALAESIRSMAPTPPPGVEPIEGWILIREDRDSR
jgi:plasmid stability protein